MSLRVTAAVAARVLRQLRRDHRTMAMLLLLPCLLVVLLWWMFDEVDPGAFDRIGPALLAIFPFTVMFLVTSVTTLRERTGGTLERLLAMPTRRLDLLAGYAVAFGLVGVVQSLITVGVSARLLGLEIAGPWWLLVLVAVVDALLGTALGLFVSAFARTEFQAVQFMPAVVIPQLLLCGLFVPRAALPPALEAVSGLLPLSYAVDAMSTLSTSSRDGRGRARPRGGGRVRGRSRGARRRHAAAAYGLRGRRGPRRNHARLHPPPPAPPRPPTRRWAPRAWPAAPRSRSSSARAASSSPSARSIELVGIALVRRALWPDPGPTISGA